MHLHVDRCALPCHQLYVFTIVQTVSVSVTIVDTEMRDAENVNSEININR